MFTYVHYFDDGSWRRMTSNGARIELCVPDFSMMNKTRDTIRSYYDYETGLVHHANKAAIIYSSGQSFWYWYGHKLPTTTQEEFEQWKKLSLFW